MQQAHKNKNMLHTTVYKELITDSYTYSLINFVIKNYESAVYIVKHSVLSVKFEVRNCKVYMTIVLRPVRTDETYWRDLFHFFQTDRNANWPNFCHGLYQHWTDELVTIHWAFQAIFKPFSCDTERSFFLAMPWNLYFLWSRKTYGKKWVNTCVPLPLKFKLHKNVSLAKRGCTGAGRVYSG